jgi:hypothetical protein
MEDMKMKEIDKLLRELVGVGGIQERLSQNYWFANSQQYKEDLNRKAEIEKILESLES